jgi:hypothetical protein
LPSRCFQCRFLSCTAYVNLQLLPMVSPSLILQWDEHFIKLIITLN